MSIQTLISCNHKVKISEIFSSYFQINVLQDPTITCVQKCFFLRFGTCTRNGSLGAFLIET